MILRRMADAIRRQDLSQIIIEILIVVIGIFLGLQVQAWYEDRAERVLEETYLNQLHDEVIAITEIAELRYGKAVRKIETLIFITHYFNDNNISPELSDDHCDIILGSHNLFSPALP
ncbi:MAG: hypothetical protein HOM63_05200, partial [Kordiimonadaceae bacterium]|nr:hypothetical protein [Kordiimonadaceae bacterium]